MKKSPGIQKSGFSIAIILIAAFLIRFGLWAYINYQDPQRFIGGDTSSYIRTAKALLYGGTFSVTLERPDLPETIRTPGYPIYLAACFAVFGVNLPIIVITQIFLSLGTIALVYGLVNSIGGYYAAVISALLLAFDLPSITYTLQVLSETLFTLMLVALIASGITILINPYRKYNYMLAGIFLSMATMVRPISYYLIIPLGAGLVAWTIVSKLNWRAILIRLLLFGLPFLLIIGGWQLRNYLLIGDASVSQIEAVNMLAFRAAKIIALRDGTSMEEAIQTLGIKDITDIRIWHQEVLLTDHWKEQALAIIKKYPGLFLRSSINGMLNVILGLGERPFMEIINGELVTIGPVDDLTRLPVLAYLQKWAVDNRLFFLAFLYALGYMFIIYLGVLLWLIMAIRQKHMTLIDLLCWGVFFYFVLISAGPEAYSRFRAPLMPILVIYAALGLQLLIIPIRQIAVTSYRREKA
jgi:4-amino-4-deoxy-L-arabinose transferase-like glycosyltransferase